MGDTTINHNLDICTTAQSVTVIDEEEKNSKTQEKESDFTTNEFNVISEGPKQICDSESSEIEYAVTNVYKKEDDKVNTSQNSSYGENKYFDKENSSSEENVEYIISVEKFLHSVNHTRINSSSYTEIVNANLYDKNEHEVDKSNNSEKDFADRLKSYDNKVQEEVENISSSEKNANTIQSIVISKDNVSGMEDIITDDIAQELTTSAQNLSEGSDYIYLDGTLAPDANSDIFADSWDWTFPNRNVNEQYIPIEKKNTSKPRAGKKYNKEINKTPARQDVSVATQTDEPSPLIGSHDEPHILNKHFREDERLKVTNDTDSKPKEADRKSRKRKKKKINKRAVFEEDVVYFEEPSSSRVFKTKLMYLHSDSNVRLKSSIAWSQIINRNFRTTKAEQLRLKKLQQSDSDEFQKRNVKRIISKLPEIESKFIRPQKKPDGPVAEKSGDEHDPGLSREETSPMSGLATLNSSLKVSSSVPDTHTVFGETITERLISWRLARGRSMSKPDVFRKSMTKDELQRDIDHFLETVKERQTGLEKFKHTARLILLILRAVGFKLQKPDNNSYNFLSWTVVYDDVLGISRLNYDSGTLTFDPLLYKANKESTVSQEVKDILKLPSNQRTEAHIHIVKVCFKQVAPSFSEFPIRIQESMIKVCTYEKFEAGRVIIRQGHRAENFYFILSGCAVVTEMDIYGNHAHTTNVLGKGNSFGELALLNMSLRSATVTCREDVELIWIERQDFIDIFMRRVVGKEADHIAFLKTVDLLNGWPINKLPAENPRICAYTYVRRGVVLCHDSAKSDWIYVIVSGSCKILKALDDVTLNKQQRIEITNEKPMHSIISIAPASSNFASIYTTTQTNEDAHIYSNTRTRRQGIVQRPDLLNETYNMLRNTSEATVASLQTDHQSQLENLFLKRHVLPSLQAEKPHQDSYNDRSSEHSSRRTSIQTLTLPALFQPKRQSYGLQPPALPEMTVPLSHKQSNVKKVFIDVARLDSGDVFGLDQVVLIGVSKVTSYSLVSDGAEVVLIDKKFFRKHLTEETLKLMRKKISPLPSEKVLQKNLETLKTWEAYKAVTLSRYASWRQKLADVPEFSR